MSMMHPHFITLPHVCVCVCAAWTSARGCGGGLEDTAVPLRTLGQLAGRGGATHQTAHLNAFPKWYLALVRLSKEEVAPPATLLLSAKVRDAGACTLLAVLQQAGQGLGELHGVLRYT